MMHDVFEPSTEEVVTIAHYLVRELSDKILDANNNMNPCYLNDIKVIPLFNDCVDVLKKISSLIISETDRRTVLFNMKARFVQKYQLAMESKIESLLQGLLNVTAFELKEKLNIHMTTSKNYIAIEMEKYINGLLTAIKN
jgi:hypothetical protein